MGASQTNYHIRSNKVETVCAALQRSIRSRAYVTQPVNGWISVYDEASDTQDEHELCRLSKALSKELKSVVFAFLVHDSDIFMYFLCDHARLVDQFNSRPDYFGEISPKEKTKWQGHPEIVCQYGRGGAKPRSISKILRKDYVLEEEKAEAFARLLGIEGERTRVGFEHLASQENKIDLGGKVGKLTLVRRKGFDVLAKDLVEAVRVGQTDAVRKLLAAGVSPNQKDKFGYSLIWVALQNKYPEVALLLIDGGADVAQAGLATGGPATECDALRTAAIFGCEPVASLAIAKGCPVDSNYPDGMTPLTEAVGRGSIEVARCLVEAGADINRATPGRGTALQFAVMGGYFSALFNIGEAMGASGKFQDDKCNWEEMVEFLLGSGADPNVSNSKENTPLMVAAHRGEQRMVEMLLRAGADPNARNADSQTALALALTMGHVEIVGMLKDAGAFSSEAEKAPELLGACLQGRTKETRALLDSGTNPNSWGPGGQTPLMLAAAKGHREVVHILLERGASVHSTDHSGATPLHFAAEAGSLEVVRQLLRAGAPPDARIGKTKLTPLSLAFGKGVILDKVPQERVEVARALIQAGADPKVKTAFGQGLLTIAVIARNSTLVKLLVRAGVSADRKAAGISPSQFAQLMGHAEIIKQLEKSARRSPKQAKRKKR